MSGAPVIVDQELSVEDLLSRMPAKDASPEEWRSYHQVLYDAGWLRPPQAAK